MRISAVAKKYSLALVSSSDSNVEKVLSELFAFAGVLAADSSLENFFANPVISSDEKFKVLDLAVAKFSGTTVGFIKTLIENKRVTSLPGIISGVQELLDEKKGISRGRVLSAQALGEELKKNLEEKIQAVVKRKIELSYDTNPGLMGGVVAHVGGWTFDDTLETQINKINDDLNRSAN